MQKKGENQRVCDVVGFGENSLDTVAVLGRMPEPDGKRALDDCLQLPGGQIATAMVGCARLGLQSRYVGTFGSDDAGRRVAEALTSEGVDIAACRRVPGASRTAIIVVETAITARTVLGHRPPAIQWPPEELPIEALTQTRALLVDATDIAAAIRACTAAREAGVVTFCDIDDDVPGLDGLLAVSDVIVASEAFAGDVRRLQRESGARMVVATLGEHGALGWDGWREYFSPAFVTPVVDSTGAGDAFRAGLIAGCLTLEWTLARGPWDAVLDRANAAAALNCRAPGAQAGLPTSSELDTFVTIPGAPRSKAAWGQRHTPSPHVASEPGDRA